MILVVVLLVFVFNGRMMFGGGFISGNISRGVFRV